MNKMALIKTPISILQETVVQQKMPLPLYQEAPSDKNTFPFKCTVKVGSIVGTGYAHTKKEAKHNCAEDILKKLGFDFLMNPVISKSPAEKEPQPKQINYIGLLNEHASLKQVSYPLYLDMLPQNGQYSVECRFLKLKCFGYGPNKKLAKQDSAKKMLERVTVEDVDYANSCRNILSKLNNSVELEKLLDKYQSLSINNDKPVNSESDVNLPQIKTANLTMDELISKLNAQGHTCTVSTFQRDPYIMVLKIDNTSYVAMGKGITKEEATNDLLCTANIIFQEGISFHPSFIKTKND